MGEKTTIPGFPRVTGPKITSIFLFSAAEAHASQRTGPAYQEQSGSLGCLRQKVTVGAPLPSSLQPDSHQEYTGSSPPRPFQVSAPPPAHKQFCIYLNLLCEFPLPRKKTERNYKGRHLSPSPHPIYQGPEPVASNEARARDGRFNGAPRVTVQPRGGRSRPAFAYILNGAVKNADMQTIWTGSSA